MLKKSTHPELLVSPAPRCSVPALCPLCAPLFALLPSDHAPAHLRVLGLTYKAPKCVSVKDYIPTLPPNEPIVFICGAFAHGQIDASFCDEEIAISEYPLSASVVCGKLCCAFEEAWGIM